MTNKTNKKPSPFEVLFSIDCDAYTDQKGGLDYLQWGFAWQQAKKYYPDLQHTIYENADGWNYHTDGRSAWVKVGVTIEGVEHIENLPVMDLYNKAVPLDKIDSVGVNKTIQRSITKCLARHGLGLTLYIGETNFPEKLEATPVWTNPSDKANAIFHVNDLVAKGKLDEAVAVCHYLQNGGECKFEHDFEGHNATDKVIRSKQFTSLWGGLGKKAQQIITTHRKSTNELISKLDDAKKEGDTEAVTKIFEEIQDSPFIKVMAHYDKLFEEAEAS